MYVTITCHPASHGAARHYTVKQRSPQGLVIFDVIARNGRQAIQAFRSQYDTQSTQKAAA